MAKTREQYNMSVEDFQKSQLAAAMLVRGNATINKRNFYGDEEVYMLWSPMHSIQIPLQRKLSKMECVAQATHLEMDAQKVLNGENAFDEYLSMIEKGIAIFPSEIQEENLAYHRQLMQKVSGDDFFTENDNMKRYILDAMKQAEKIYEGQLEMAIADERQG